MTKFNSSFKNLFNILVELRQEFNCLSLETENLNEIAMNAAVTAGQTGNSIRIYTEISNQIANSSKKMKNFIDKNRSEVNTILNLTLKILSNNMMNNKYLETTMGNSTKNNAILLKEKLDKINLYDLKIFDDLAFHVYKTKAFLKTILQLQYKLFGLYNCLMIEAIELEASSYTAIKTLSDSLYKSFEMTIPCLENLFAILKKILRIIKNLS
ncbi:MAG: hypothetical protein DCC88_05025 [Spirobacillus cienkowskii]|jgi:hypothetical protein|uniref:Uncharacterized protein n=1 Tax=Spirobacillus cienkowskii TaxID=495820 RepID=A0A369KUV6_9BACT|nr:MAG: hypothetical protein DCC88_05025 [Spirobacillus cienkowskii]